MRISTVIVTKDRPRSLRRCIASLRKQLARGDEIIVVDGGTSTVSGVRYFREPRPGRCLARNIGIAHARNELVLFVDDDTELMPGCITQLRNSFRDGVAGVGGVEVAPPHAPRAWTVSEKINDFFINYMNPFHHLRGNEIRSSGRVAGHFKEGQRMMRAGHLKGFCMAFRRDALRSVGGFDEWYARTAHREETDLCCRIASCGHLVVNPAARCIHYGAAEGRDDPFSRMHAMYKQHQYFVFKNRLLRVGGIPEYVLGESLEAFMALALCILGRDFRYLSLIGAKLDGIREGIIARHAKGAFGDL